MVQIQAVAVEFLDARGRKNDAGREACLQYVQGEQESFTERLCAPSAIGSKLLHVCSPYRHQPVVRRTRERHEVHLLSWLGADNISLIRNGQLEQDLALIEWHRVECRLKQRTRMSQVDGWVQWCQISASDPQSRTPVTSVSASATFGCFDYCRLCRHDFHLLYHTSGNELTTKAFR